MSPAAGRDGRRGTRTAVVAVGLLVLVLVAVLVGLLRPGSDQTEPQSPASHGASTTRASTRASTSASSHASPPARDPESGLRLVALADLPQQAQETVALIEAGGPFPYAKDGATFSNNERLLPIHPRGWYREYTVATPGDGDRGPRRIVTGDHDRQVFYTADHYSSFVRVSR